MIIPASIRNKNPGAQYPGPSAKKFGATGHEILRSKDGTHKIATFPSHIQGAAAMFDLLHEGRNRLGVLQYRGRTVEEAIKTWCGGFYVSTYIKVLEQAGVRRTDKLTSEVLRDPAKAVPLAKAMALQEAGKEYPLSDADWAQAHACAFVQQVAPSFKPDNDVPSPKPETREADAIRRWGVPAGIGLTGVTAPSLPSPPDLAQVQAWQSFADDLKNIVLWGAQSWPWLAAAGAAYLVLGHLVPAWAARRPS